MASANAPKDDSGFFDEEKVTANTSVGQPFPLATVLTAGSAPGRLWTHFQGRNFAARMPPLLQIHTLVFRSTLCSILLRSVADRGQL